MRVIWIALFALAILQIEARGSELLVRKKKPSSSSAFSFSSQSQNSNEVEPVEKKHFTSPQEKQDFIESLDADEYEWEENQVYQGTDYSVNAEIQAIVASEIKLDPYFATQWSLYATSSDPARFSGVDIDAVRAWKVTKGSDNVIVYIMDSGIVQAVDPDFENRIVAYYDGTNPGQFPDDQNSHGTHVASIVGALGDNNAGIRGVVPGKLQMGIGRFLDSSNKGSTDTALRVIDWIYEDYTSRKKTNSSLRCVVNNSWDGGFSQFLEDSLKKLADAGCFLVTSAGNNARNNDQTPDYPCNYKKIKSQSVCVGATDANDKRAYFSSYGPGSVDLYAPGVNIVGNVPGKTQNGVYVGKTETKNGTSQAVPQVTGVAALILAANGELTNEEVRKILIQSVDRLPGADAEVYSGGRLNAYRAVLVATGQDPSQADRGFASQDGGGGGCAMQVSVSQTRTTAPRDYVWILALGAAIALFWLRGSTIAVVRSRADKRLRVPVRRQIDGDANNR